MDRPDEAEKWYSKARGVDVLKVRNELKEVYQQTGQGSKADELESQAAFLITDE
jgi:hypothetical protein